MRGRNERGMRVSLRMRALALVAMLVSAAILFSYLYVIQRHGPDSLPKVKARFLKSRGGRQSVLDKELAMSPRQHDLTIVTAYINIGSFRKGEGGIVFTPEFYRKWVTIFHRVSNPVIAFFDDDHDAQMFRVLRSSYPANMTRIISFRRDTSWAFSLRPEIEKIFRQPSYPKHHPNTVNPDYVCAMHAKYEMMARAVAENPFKTKYFSWLDAGLFRAEVAKREPPFSMVLPPGFDNSKIAYTKVDKLERRSISAKNIVTGNYVWLCGCYFVGRYDVMARWTEQYKAFTNKMLKTGMMSTDQQVLYYMYQPENKLLPIFDVSVQPYKGNGKYNDWFHLGYLSRKLKTTKKEKDKMNVTTTQQMVLSKITEV